jgi:hypothetical protein
MRVVEAKQPFAALVMERERVGETMWPLGRHGNSFHDKLDPALPIGIGDKRIAVKKQERVETRITTAPQSLYYHGMISKFKIEIYAS